MLRRGQLAEASGPLATVQAVAMTILISPAVSDDGDATLRERKRVMGFKRSLIADTKSVVAALLPSLRCTLLEYQQR